MGYAKQNFKDGDILNAEKLNKMDNALYLSANPLVLYAGSAEEYTADATYGDEALNAILNGRQIFVRVPNADGGTYTANYSPVMMYQLPNYQNNYLYLIYLNDSTDGSISYGQLKMLLSDTYNATPLV